jgi:hypothetical protein
MGFVPGRRQSDATEAAKKFAYLARSASGDGGFGIDAIFVRRWAASPVPNKTTSTPGS